MTSFAEMQQGLPSVRLLADFESILTGDLSRFRSGSAASDYQRPNKGANDLLSDGKHAAIIERFSVKFGQTDPRDHVDVGVDLLH